MGFPSQRHVARIGAREARDAPEQRGLAAAVCAAHARSIRRERRRTTRRGRGRVSPREHARPRTSSALTAPPCRSRSSRHGRRASRRRCVPTRSPGLRQRVARARDARLDAHRGRTGQARGGRHRHGVVERETSAAATPPKCARTASGMRGPFSARAKTKSVSDGFIFAAMAGAMLTEPVRAWADIASGAAARLRHRRTRARDVSRAAGNGFPAAAAFWRSSSRSARTSCSSSDPGSVVSRGSASRPGRPR